MGIASRGPFLSGFERYSRGIQLGLQFGEVRAQGTDFVIEGGHSSFAYSNQNRACINHRTQCLVAVLGVMGRLQRQAGCHNVRGRKTVRDSTFLFAEGRI